MSMEKPRRMQSNQFDYNSTNIDELFNKKYDSEIAGVRKQNLRTLIATLTTEATKYVKHKRLY